MDNHILNVGLAFETLVNLQVGQAFGVFVNVYVRFLLSIPSGQMTRLRNLELPSAAQGCFL